MKKVLLTIAILTGILSNAQDNEFKYNKKTGISQYDSRTVFAEINDYIVIEKEGTAKELYEYVNDWVLKTYVDPENVTKANDGSDYIRVKGKGKVIVNNDKLIGHTYFINPEINYTISFRFKDNKIKMTLISCEYKGVTYAAGTTIDLYLNYKSFAISNKNGKKIKTDKVKTAFAIAKYFNDLSTSLQNHDLIENLNNDW